MAEREGGRGLAASNYTPEVHGSHPDGGGKGLRRAAVWMTMGSLRTGTTATRLQSQSPTGRLCRGCQLGVFMATLPPRPGWQPLSPRGVQALGAARRTRPGVALTTSLSTPLAAPRERAGCEEAAPSPPPGAPTWGWHFQGTMCKAHQQTGWSAFQGKHLCAWRDQDRAVDQGRPREPPAPECKDLRGTPRGRVSLGSWTMAVCHLPGWPTSSGKAAPSCPTPVAGRRDTPLQTEGQRCWDTRSDDS